MDGTAFPSLQWKPMVNQPSTMLPSTTETHPWGAYQDLFEAEGFLVKLIDVAPRRA